MSSILGKVLPPFSEPMETSSAAPTSKVLTSHPRACATCARAKAKCVIEDDGKCQRCHRLKKFCEPALEQARSQPRKRRSEPASRAQKSHVANLEKKLDGLVTLLKSTQERSSNEGLAPMNFNTSPAPSRPVLPFTAASQSSQSSQSSHEEIPGQGWIHLEITNSTASSQPGLTPDGWVVTPDNSPATDPTLNHPSPPILQRVDFTSDEANLLLNRWRDDMAPFFPFIIVPASLSAQDLQRDRPYLLKSILAVASRDCGQQLALGKWLVRQLAERVAINGERNLDLLLGLLTYTGWCFYNCYNIPQLTCLLSLGMALVFDLGLNRPPPSSANTNRSLFEIALRETTNPGFPRWVANVTNQRTLEDRRAVLGIFFISSAASKFFRSKIDPLKITPYIYECLETLDKAQEQPTDICATSLVRLQMIVERISHSPWNTDYGMPERYISSPPPILYVKSIQEQLKDFRSAMTPEMGTRGYMLMHYYHVEESLYEVALSRSPAMGNYSSHDFNRLELLYACLQSNKLFFETFFAIPEYRYFSFSLATWTQVTHSIMILQLLSTFEHPDWNTAYVRETIDFMEVMDKIIERFNKVEGQTFARTASKMASIRAHIQEKMGADAVGPRPGSLSGEDADMGRTWEPYDFLDESWLADVLGPMDSQFNMPGIL